MSYKGVCVISATHLLLSKGQLLFEVFISATLTKYCNAYLKKTGILHGTHYRLPIHFSVLATVVTMVILIWAS